MIFFIGSAKDSCTINGQKVELVYAGNFCPVFPLELGENIFEIEIDGKSFQHVITRKAEPDVVIQPAEIHPSSQEAIHSNKSFTVDGSFPLTAFGVRMTRICLDPGHGGSARGTCSPKGLAEKDLNLSLALKIKKELEAKGFQVKLTRETDEDLSLQARVDICKNFNSDLFISIHHNAIPDHLNPLEHHGLSCHYYYKENQALAENLSAKLSQGLNLKNNGAIWQDLHVLRENTFCPAVLIEFGYLIHPQESELISSTGFQIRAGIECSRFFEA